MNIIIGPPGTGKTSTLLSLVEDHIEKGIPPYKIGYFAFTNRASDEARERAYSKFNLGSDDLPFFRTLHSLAFQRLGLSRSQVLNDEQRREFGHLMGLEIRGHNSLEEGSLAFSKKGDQILGTIEVARVRGVTTHKQWLDDNLDINWYEIDRAERGLNAFKRERHLYDFTDMLSLFVDQDLAPDLDVVFIDEAQDLSFLQWQLVSKLQEKAKHTYIAGDDDQAIFRWAGADVNHFLSLEGNIQVLDQSYRVPQHAHYLADSIVKRVSKRRAKFWKPRPKEGKLFWHSNIEHIDMREGKWLVLARNNYMLNSIEQQCRLEGFFYQRGHRKSVSEPLLNAILAWEKLRKGGVATIAQVRSIYKYMSSDRGVSRTYKMLKAVFDEEQVTLQKLLESYGLLTTAIWHEALDKVSDKEKQYLIACLRRGEKFTVEPRIKLSTIHGAKGSECDNVVVLTDRGQKSWLQM